MISCDTRTQTICCSPLQETVKQESDVDIQLKLDYIKELMNIKDTSYMESSLVDLSLDTLQPLYLALRNIFTDKCDKDCRYKIIKFLLTVDPILWEELLKETTFIMPHGTKGHDLTWAVETLSAIKDLTFRKQLVHVANRLFKYDTLTIERGYILNTLKSLDSEKLSKIDKYDEKERDEFFAKHVPASLKIGAKITYRYDPIARKGCHV